MPDDHDDDWLALLDDDDDPSPADRAAVVDRLAPAFAAHHRAAKDHLKHVLVPVARHTKQLHDAVHDQVFPRRAHGLALLDRATTAFDDAAHRDRDAAQSVYDDAKRALDALFATLDDLVRQSDLLFQTFKAGMQEHAHRLGRCAGHMPADAERLIAALDTKAKHLGAEDHAKAKENLLRGILEKY